MNSTAHRGIGLMCGTSQDALDLADVSFRVSEQGIDHQVHGTHSFPLPHSIAQALKRVFDLTPLQLSQLDHEIGRFFGRCVLDYAKSLDAPPDYIASHGITAFHQPKNGFSVQLGHGGTMAVTSNILVVNDFRSQDIALGGQGAPLVPFCDRDLFKDFDFTLNLGGFANITRLGEPLLGYDVGVANLLLNHLISETGKSFDRNGDMAATGKVIPEMLEALNQLPYFRQEPPKSLGVEWLVKELFPILDRFIKHQLQDRLRTAVEHIALQIGSALSGTGSCLVTGGGAKNNFLTQRIQENTIVELEVPDEALIEFKEAICFAYLGWKRLRNEPNTEPSVTGARHAVSAGAIYLP